MKLEITPAKISYFLALHAELKFGRAATRCGVRQPSLSIAIRDLENQIGGKLFEREQPLRLTHLGRALLKDFQKVHRAHQKLLENIENQKNKRELAARRASAIKKINCETGSASARSP